MQLLLQLLLLLLPPPLPPPLLLLLPGSDKVLPHTEPLSSLHQFLANLADHAPEHHVPEHIPPPPRSFSLVTPP